MPLWLGGAVLLAESWSVICIKVRLLFVSHQNLSEIAETLANVFVANIKVSVS